MKTVFDRLIAAGLKLKAKKCTLFAKEVLYLGHVISEEGVATDPEKVKVIQDWPEPCNVSEVRSFLGLCGYYRRFVEKFSERAKPLSKLTEKGAAMNWTQDCRDAFRDLKDRLCKAPILAMPDFNHEFILDTDASNLAIGAVLSQNIDGIERPIAYASRTLSKAERQYCVTRKELLAVVNFTKYFKHYLYGKQFTVRTDHSSLRWLLNFKNPEGQLARWIEALGNFEMKIEHRPGKQHSNADALSRLPCKKCCIPEEPSVSQVRSVAPDTKMKSLQKKDAALELVRNWVLEGKRPAYSAISSEGRVVKSLWSQFEALVVEDDILYRRWIDGKGTKLQAVVPSGERRTVLGQHHDNRVSGHLGMTKTVAKIRQRFYWPGLQSDVRAYIAGCEKCSKRKGFQKAKRSPMQIVQVGAPMERIATDILGELPVTNKGNKYILVVSDYYSKWTESFPMRNMEAETVAKVIVEQVITRFGVPYVIHSDQGAQFESKLFADVCQLLGIKKTRTSPYHPKSDGMVERFNKTLATMLSAYVDEHQKDWDTHLPYVMMAYRSAEHETTGCTPNAMMLGREVATPLDVMFEMPATASAVPQNVWAWELKQRMEEAHTAVRQHTGQEMRRQKRYHDAKINWQSFQKGDAVYVFFPRRKVGHSPKFTSYWRGPFTIVSKKSDLLYEVNCGYREQSQIIHADRIRLLKPQVLADEAIVENMEDEVESVNTHDLLDTHVEGQDVASDRRIRKPPIWFKDYDQ